MEAISSLIRMLGTIELPTIGVADILQIIVIAVVLYHVLVWIQNTRTWFLFKGILILLVFYIAAVVLELNTILFIVQNSLGVFVTAMIVVFQPELRKALEQLGQGNMFFNFLTNDVMEGEFDQKCIEELVKASFALGRTRTGALIVIQRQLSLDEYIRTGIEVDAILTSPLLINIFEHNTPLHDGAVVVQGNRVVSATCYLPLSKNQDISKDLGTRHRAAIGVSEVTDSLTLVVSEETGKVSVAEHGELSHGLTPDQLRERLMVLHTPKENRTSAFRFWKGRKKNENNDSE